jgi:hypothetical protein
MSPMRTDLWDHVRLPTTVMYHQTKGTPMSAIKRMRTGRTLLGAALAAAIATSVAGCPNTGGVAPPPAGMGGHAHGDAAVVATSDR